MAMLSVGRARARAVQRHPGAAAVPGRVLRPTLGLALVPLLIMVILGVLAAFILNLPGLPRCTPSAVRDARLSGINVARQKLIIYALSGTFSAIAVSCCRSSGSGSRRRRPATNSTPSRRSWRREPGGRQGPRVRHLIGALVLAVIRNGLNLLNVSRSGSKS